MARGKVLPAEKVKDSWLNIRLTQQERAAVDARAEAEGVTPTELGRRGLAVILAQQTGVTPAIPATK